METTLFEEPFVVESENDFRIIIARYGSAYRMVITTASSPVSMGLIISPIALVRLYDELSFTLKTTKNSHKIGWEYENYKYSFSCNTCSYDLNGIIFLTFTETDENGNDQSITISFNDNNQNELKEFLDALNKFRIEKKNDWKFK